MTITAYDPAHWKQTSSKDLAHRLKWSETLAVPGNNALGLPTTINYQIGLSKYYTSIDQFTTAAADGATYAVDSSGYITKKVPNSDYIGADKVAIDTSGFSGIITTQKDIEAFRLTINAPVMYASNPKYGYVWTQVDVAIYYKKTTETLWTALNPRFSIIDKVPSEVVRYISSPKLEYSKYDILVFRLTPDNSTNYDVHDTVYIKEITEIVYSKLRYNHTALLGLKIRATDQLSGQVPTVTSLVKGLKVAVPEGVMHDVVVSYSKTGSSTTGTTSTTSSDITDGTSTSLVTKTFSVLNPEAGPWNGHLTYEEGDPTRQTKYFSQNPVWCLYDLLTNKRYGLGNYYKIDPTKRGIMLANFFLAAKYCDELIPYTAPDGTTQHRPRFTLNIVLDQSKAATEWIGTICAVMRATVFYTEGMLWIDIDRPKYMSQIFTMSSIKEFSQTGISYRSVPNAYEVQWINPDTDYQVDSFRLESKELQSNPQIEERKKALMLLGTTNFEEAKCQANYALLAGQHRTKTITFKTNTNGLRCMIADVIGIQHDVPEWGWGGKIVAYDNVTRTVTFSSPLYPTAYTDDTVPALCQYFLNFAPGAGGLVEVELQHDSNWNGDPTLSAVLLEEPATLPAPGMEYEIGEVTKGKIPKFKILSIKRDSDELVEIAAVEYDDQIYSLADNSNGLGEWVITDYSFLDVPNRASVQGLTGNTRIYQDAAGAYCTGVDIFYAKPVNDNYWRSANLYYAKAGSTNYTSVENNTSGSFWVTDITEPGDYQFIVTSNYNTGRQSIADALNDWDKHPYIALHVDLFASNDIALEGVSGLSITNKANDGTFLGKDCVISWKPTATIDASANIEEAGTEVNGAGAAATVEWLGYYQVDIKNLDGSLRRSAKIQTESYTYTHENNHSDGVKPARTFIVEVTTYDKLGRKSASKSITVNNPSPAKLV